MIEQVEELKQVQNLTQLYYKSQLQECIDLANSLETISTFSLYQKVQLYKSLSLIESGFYHEGFENLESLINEGAIKKGEQIEEIDLMIRVFQLWELYFYNSNRAELLNDKLNEECEQFLKQNSALPDYNHGVYLFGRGSYLFFDTIRSSKKKEPLELLVKATYQLKEYEQDIILLISFIYNELDNFEKSIEYLTRLLNMNPQFPGINNYFAILYEKKQDYKKAEEYYFNALRLLPNNTIIMNNLASFYWNTGQREKSQEYIQKSYEINPKSSYTCFVYGSILGEQKQIEKAIQILKQGLEYDSMDCDLYYELFKIEYKKSNFVKCIMLLEDCNTINPFDGFYQYEIGRVLEENESYQSAEKYLKKALQMKIKDFTRVAACTLLANCFYRQQKYLDAFNQYLVALNLDVKNIDMSVLFVNTGYLINNEKFLREPKILEILNHFNGPFLSRIDSLIQKVTNKNVITLLKFKLDRYQQTVMQYCYQTQILPYLTFQNEISHWDLYFD